MPRTIEAGIQTIEGRIVSVSWRSRANDKKWGTWSRRPHVGMLVSLDNGAELWATMPRSVEQALIPLLFEHRDQFINYAELVEETPVPRPVRR